MTRAARWRCALRERACAHPVRTMLCLALPLALAFEVLFALIFLALSALTGQPLSTLDALSAVAWSEVLFGAPCAGWLLASAIVLHETGAIPSTSPAPVSR